MHKYLAIFGKPRYLGILEYNKTIEKGSRVVVESNRGEEIAVIAGLINEEQEKRYRSLRSTMEQGNSNSKNTEQVVTDLKFQRFTTDKDLDETHIYRSEEKAILRKAKELLVPHKLDMKMIDVEFLLKKKKLFFYFSSDERVDFRSYVRDLAREFKTRIELRQIGVRDETKIVSGIGPCGRQCCCGYWLNQFSPVCIKMVKEQNLALNPTKISGICGRLMCCLCYEQDAYHDMWKGLPHPGSKIKTPNGNVILLGIELHKENARFYVPGKGEVKVPIKRYAEFKQTVVEGKEWEPDDEKDVLDFHIPEFNPENVFRVVHDEEKTTQKRNTREETGKKDSSSRARNKTRRRRVDKRKKENKTVVEDANTDKNIQHYPKDKKNNRGKSNRQNKTATTNQPSKKQRNNVSKDEQSNQPSNNKVKNKRRRFKRKPTNIHKKEPRDNKNESNG